jgi:cell division protein FtsB
MNEAAETMTEIDDWRARIADVVAEESANGAAVGWRPCTGCHETCDGHEIGHYPHSDVFGCSVGSGCSECGGLGVVWEYWSKEALDDMQRDARRPPISEGVEAEAKIRAWTDKWVLYDDHKAAITALSAELERVRANCETVCDSYVAENQRLHDRATSAEAENARLRASLDKIASWTQSEGLLWWQTEARAALSGDQS